MLLEIHALQSFAPSNLNRDESGAPKSCVFGGVPRARISSQCQKRAARLRFDDAQRGVRTRRLGEMLRPLLAERVSDGDRVEALTLAAVAILKGKEGRQNQRSRSHPEEVDALLLTGARELTRMADELTKVDDPGDHTAVKAAVTAAVEVSGQGFDAATALFGRMLASLPAGTVDSAVQVAHAISTHATNIDFDYFTAVDDEVIASAETGAGMVGQIPFNSATYYRYAVVDTEQLAENLPEDVDAANLAIEFLRAFALSVPSGHQNSFAAHQIPALTLLTIASQPMSLANAFLEPVSDVGGRLLARSAERLADHFQASCELLGGEFAPVPVGAAVQRDLVGDRVGNLPICPSIPVLFEAAEQRLRA